MFSWIPHLVVLKLSVWHNLQVSITSEDNRAVESKGIGRKLIDRLYQTYSSEFAGKRFAYDGEKSLYTVGPLPQNKSEFTVVLEESFAKQYVILPQTSLVFLYVLWFCITLHSLSCGSESGSPGGGESPPAAVKRSKRSFRSKTFKVEISYAAKIPLKSIALALKGIEIDNSTQDALRVLDIILRQQAANRFYSCLTSHTFFFLL